MSATYEFNRLRQLVEVDGDYRTTVEKIRGSWLVHCRLCKQRFGFDQHARAIECADQHPRSLTHQRWTGRLVLGGHLSVARGYDSGGSLACRCEVCDDCHVNGAIRAQVRAEAARMREARDDLAARRVVPPPMLKWTTGSPLGSATVTWANGVQTRGTFYGLYADGRWVAKIVALAEGGWLFHDRFVADDQALIRAAS